MAAIDINDGTPDASPTNRAILLDTLTELIAAHLPTPSAPRSSSSKPHRSAARRRTTTPAPDIASSDAADLADFIEYLAAEIWDALPPEWQRLSPSSPPSLLARADDTAEADALAGTAPSSVTEALAGYGLLALPDAALDGFLATLYARYLGAAAVGEAHPTSAKGDDADDSDDDGSGCALCARTWIPLTDHHLVPRSVAAKAVRRGWVADEAEARRTARLCRACHSHVHSVCGNEELARSFRTVEALAAREDVRRFVSWVGRVRWKKR